MHTMATRGRGSVSCLLLFALLASRLPVTASRRLHLGHCVINVHTQELKQHFSEIRQIMLTEDRHMGLKLLNSHTMKDVQPMESCCFLRMLLRFYVEKVFSRYTAGQAHVRTSTSSLANSFWSIKTDLRQCHAHMQCHCQEQTGHKFAAIQASFETLNEKEGAVKAMGELDSLLDWLDGFHHARHHS